jgi:hypothetical protein
MKGNDAMTDTAHQLAERAIATHGPANAARIYRETEAAYYSEAQWCDMASDERRKEQLAEGYGRIAAIIEQLTGKA